MIYKIKNLLEHGLTFKKHVKEFHYQLSEKNKDEYMNQLLEVCKYRRWLMYNFDSVKEILFWSTRHDSIAVVISKDNNIKCVKYYKTYKYDSVKKRYSDIRTDGKWINEAGMSFGYTYKVFNEEDPVCVVEGVHDLITMELLNWNYICLESAQTTLENNRELRRLIEKRKVLWVGDNDEPGKQSYKKNKNVLQYESYEMNKLEWKELENKYDIDFKDISDFVCSFEDDSTIEDDFYKYTKHLRTYLFSSFAEEIVTLDLRKDLGEDIEYLTPTDKMLYSLPFGYPVIFYGRGAAGKTTLMVHYTIEVMLNTNKRVFLWLSEDTNNRISRNFMNTLNWKYPDKKDYLLSELAKRTTLASGNMVPVSLIGIGLNRQPKLTADYYSVRKKLKDYDFIVFDPLSWFIAESDMSNNTYMSFFFRNMRQWAVEENKCIIFLHHQNKTEKVGNQSGRFLVENPIFNQANLIYHVESSIDNHIRVRVVKNGIYFGFKENDPYPIEDINAIDVKIHK